MGDLQERQVQEARSAAAAESDARLVEEMAAREAALSAALAEAQASLTNMQRLHELSQKQIFMLQSRTEEEQVCAGPFKHVHVLLGPSNSVVGCR